MRVALFSPIEAGIQPAKFVKLLFTPVGELSHFDVQ
jgi:hypothetical protein